MSILSTQEWFPVELWDRILPFALETWLLPGTEGDLLGDILLFRGGCESITEYTRVESIRRRLRAVCRFWKEIMDKLALDFTLSNFGQNTAPSKYILPRSKRIEFRPRWRCTCDRCPEKFSAPDASLREDQRLRQVNPEIFSQTNPPFNPECAQVILVDLPGKDMAEYITHASRLTALKGTLSSICGTQGLQVQHVFNRLTHLVLSKLSPNEMKDAYQFPRLRFLQVVLNMGLVSYSRIPHVPLWRWELPKLVSLVIRGDVDDFYQEDVEKFLRSHSSTITDLILGYKGFTTRKRYYQPPESYPNPFQSYFPLKTLGIQIRELDLLNRGLSLRNEGSAPIRDLLFLDDAFSQVRGDRDELPSRAQLCIKFCTPPTSLCERIILFHSWGELSHIYQDQVVQQRKRQAWGDNTADSVFISPLAFFKAIYKSGINCVDRDGVRLGERTGLELLKMMGLVEQH